MKICYQLSAYPAFQQKAEELLSQKLSEKEDQVKEMVFDYNYSCFVLQLLPLYKFKSRFILKKLKNCCHYHESIN